MCCLGVLGQRGLCLSGPLGLLEKARSLWCQATALSCRGSMPVLMLPPLYQGLGKQSQWAGSCLLVSLETWVPTTRTPEFTSCKQGLQLEPRARAI